MTFGVTTSSTNAGPAVTTTPPVALHPISGYAASQSPPAIISPGVIGQAAADKLTLTADQNDNIILFDALAGSTITLPPATGSGAKYKFVVATVCTSNSHKVITDNSKDFMAGVAFLEASATVTGYVAAAASTRSVNLNATTTGGLSIGDSFVLQDIELALWHVSSFMGSASGTVATPFATS